MKSKFSIALSLAVILSMLLTSLALASGVDVSVVDVNVPLEAVTLAPGATGNITINLSVTGNQVGTATFEVYRDWTLSGGTFTGSNPQEFTVPPRAGGDPTTTFSTSGTVKVAAGQTPGGPFTVTIGVFDITNTNSTGAKLSAGQSDTYSVTVSSPPPPSDTTAPAITPHVAATLGSNGWYVSNVTVSWAVVDNESSISSSTGCETTTISSDTSGTTLTCSAASAGGTSSQSVTIKRDATAPTISGFASPAPNGAGWNNSDVAVTFLCNDNLSGVASCGPDSTLSSDGSGLSVSGTVFDAAGNSASTIVSGINLDKTAPDISGATDRAANGNGWYNADVTVSFTCTDGGSGVASCSDPVTLGEGANQSATGTATDYAGNSTSATISGINIDKTKPTISAAATTSPNGAGWYNSNVTVEFTCNDTLSGIAAGACPADEELSDEGLAVSSTARTVTDNAGNTSDSSNVVTVSIDKTGPVVAVTGVTDGASYTLGSVPAAGCSTSDSLSGVATNANLNLTGSGPVGSFTATCSGALDNAGNGGNTAIATYNVIYNWNGFFQPVDNLPALNKAKAGSAIPVKFSLSGNQGLNIFAAGYPSSKLVACGDIANADLIETTVTAGGSSLSYDALADQYIYVWKTDKAWAGTCRTLTVKLTDGTTHQANFQFTK